MIRLACISDMHGHLPSRSTLNPDLFDVLLIAGDICPVINHDHRFQYHWLHEDFRDWLHAIKRPIFGVAGNHDLIFERSRELVGLLRLPWTYLQDSGTTLPNGMTIYGSPWQPTFGTGWAFNLSERELALKWSMIPDDTDVLLLHGPPRGYGDRVERDGGLNGGLEVGSPSLTGRIYEVKPACVIAGHIHEGYGRYDLRHDGGWGEKTVVVNASHVDERYRPVNLVIILELED